jgi:methyl-accepting chemotaxis protein
MALTNIPASLQQYDPPILPKTWQSDGRKFYNRLVEVLDDIYRRYGRLTFTDFAPAVNEWKITNDASIGLLQGGYAELGDDLALLRQDVDGNSSLISQQAGQITQIVQDVAGNLSAITQQAGQIQQLVVDVEGNQTLITQQAGQITQLAQDIEGNASAITQQAGQIAQIVQDVAGNTSAITQQAGQITQMVEDIAGNTSVIAQQAGQISQLVTDTAGNSTLLQQQAGQISQIATDVAGNSSAIYQNAQSIQSLVTNAAGMLTMIQQNADAIATKASASTVDALTGRVTAAETTILQQAAQILLKASAATVDALNGRVVTAESELAQQAGQIALKASQTQVDALAGAAVTTGSLLAILKTMIGAQVYEATYSGGPIGQGTAFPSNPKANAGFIRTDYTPPRFYVYESGAWVEKSAQTLKTSGVTIQPGQVDISTPNLNINLLNPGGGGQSLISMTPSGMVFRDAGGNTVFNFNTATGSLMISGTILAAAGMIGGFEITNSSLRNGDNILLDSMGLIRIGSSTAPYFSVNDVQTYFGNAVVIKPGALPVTNLRPNLYYDNVTGVLYRTTWQGTLSLAAVMSLSPAQVDPSGTVTVAWQVTGGTAPYQIQYTAYLNGSAIAQGSRSGAATGSFTISLNGAAPGTLNVQATVNDSEGAQLMVTSNSITVRSAQNLTVTLSGSRQGYAPQGGWIVRLSVSVSGGSGSYQTTFSTQYDGGPWVEKATVNGTVTTISGLVDGAIARATVYDRSTGASAVSNVWYN